MHFDEETWERKAFLLAEQGISLRCSEEHEAALAVCQAAAILAQKYLQGHDIYHWVMSGYGESLRLCERYEESIQAILPSCEWGRNHDIPGFSLIMAQCLLALNRPAEAEPYLLELHEKTGDEITDMFPERYHNLIRERVCGPER